MKSNQSQTTEQELYPMFFHPFSRLPFLLLFYPSSSIVLGFRIRLFTVNSYTIIGGAGFVGSHLVDKLMIQGQEVIVLDN